MLTRWKGKLPAEHWITMPTSPSVTPATATAKAPSRAAPAISRASGWCRDSSACLSPRVIKHVRVWRRTEKCSEGYVIPPGQPFTYFPRPTPPLTLSQRRLCCWRRLVGKRNPRQNITHIDTQQVTRACCDSCSGVALVRWPLNPAAEDGKPRC